MGKARFEQYCSSCHGTAKGDGPLVTLLTTKPADLTNSRRTQASSRNQSDAGTSTDATLSGLTVRAICRVRGLNFKAAGTTSSQILAQRVPRAAWPGKLFSTLNQYRKNRLPKNIELIVLGLYKSAVRFPFATSPERFRQVCITEEPVCKLSPNIFLEQPFPILRACQATTLQRPGAPVPARRAQGRTRPIYQSRRAPRRGNGQYSPSSRYSVLCAGNFGKQGLFAFESNLRTARNRARHCPEASRWNQYSRPFDAPATARIR